MYGTLISLNDLAAITININLFNERTLQLRVAEALQLHNRWLAEAVADFAFLTDQYLWPYGTTTDTFTMQALDEVGIPDVQKGFASGTLGLPLRFYGTGVQWTRMFVLNMPVNRFIALLDMAALADVKAMRRAIWQAIFHPTNTLGYQDVRDTRLTYDVKALLNADGMGIPPGPNGEVFDGTTHTHYVANTSLTQTNLSALVTNVLEHGVTGGMRLFISRADEATVRGFTPNFQAYVASNIQQALTTTYATGVSLDVFNPADRAIGVYDGAEVWVKPQVPANYQVAMDTANGADKALGIRTRTGGFDGMGAFGTIFEMDEYPLRATALGREYGVGVVNRHKVAVQYSGGATFVEPTMV